jgi:hypothetical protein
MSYSLVIAAISLFLSAFTLWRTHLRHGQLQMTTPTLIFMSRDQPSRQPKIFVRTLLFGTGVRGWVIESLYLRVRQHDPQQVHLFDFWGYNDGKMTLGSGLFVKPEGIVCDHHFNPRNGDNFVWWGGTYEIEMYARIFGKRSPRLLKRFSFTLPNDQAVQLAQIDDAGAFLELGAEDQQYHSHIERRTGPWPASDTRQGQPGSGEPI